MKKLLILGLLFEAVATLSCQAADFYLSNTLNSSHVFRGAVVNSEAVWQPSIEVDTDSGFYGWVWANMDLSDNGGLTDFADFSEMDFMLGYSHSFNKLTLSYELTEYTYPSSDTDDTRELLVRVSYDTFLNPSFSIIEDFDAVNGMYAMGSISQELYSTGSFDLTAMASLGWGDKDYNLHYYDFYDSGTLDFCVGMMAGIQLRNNLSVLGHLKYTTIMDKDIQYSAYTRYGHENFVWGGVTVNYSF